MNQEERLKKIAEAAYYRSERRGFSGDCQLEDWLAAEREVAAIITIDTEPRSTDHAPAAAPPEEGGGIPVPAPLAGEERARTDEAKQSAKELSAGVQESSAATSKPASTRPASAAKKSRKRPSAGTELGRNV